MSFNRIMNMVFEDNEEIRYDYQASKVSAVDYRGLAISGTSIDAAEWKVIREEYGPTGTITRRRYRDGVKWSERSEGW